MAKIGQTSAINSKKFGADLRQFMQKHNMSANQLAKWAGVSECYINRLRNGIVDTVSVITFEAVCTVLEKKPEDYFVIPQENNCKTPISNAKFDDFNWDQLYKTVYGAMFAVMEQFWK